MSPSVKDIFVQLKETIGNLTVADTLNLLHRHFTGGIVFSTSFSYEDQVVTDLIARSGVPVELFTLDTGRLFPETYYTWNQTLEKYGLPIKAMYPPSEEIGAFVSQHGPNSFYDSVELRKECCRLRKVVPLANALKGKQVWITGLRAEHSPGRNELEILEWDEAYSIIKYNPVLHYSTAEIKDYVYAHQVPYNPLHEKGFVSIGCAPCTRAIRPGEDFRAGRWWWEDAGKKECGLHGHESTTKEQ